MNNPGSPAGAAVIALCAITVCLKVLAEILPHVLPGLVLLAVLVILVRLVFSTTRRW